MAAESKSGSADVSFAQPIIVDNGSGTIKAGFAGEDRPKTIFRSHVGRPKYDSVMTSGAIKEGGAYVGSKAEEHRGAMRLTYPIEHGVVTNWDDMELIWQHMFSDAGLGISSADSPVLLTQPVFHPLRTTERTAEILFEKFNVPAIQFAPQAVLTLYASGATTGAVLDCGAGVSSAVPVYEGFAIKHAIQRSDVAGRDVTRHMQLLLRKAGCVLHTSAELEIVRAMKEKLCYVARSPSVEEETFDRNAKHCNYTLPDGTSIIVGPERFRAPEVLFDPTIVGTEYDGVHQLLANSIYRADTDLRRPLFGQIILAGCSTLFAGFGDRLLSEVNKLAPHDTAVRIVAPKERQVLPWVGGSILASLGSFKSMWVTQKQFEEERSAIHRKGL